MPVPRAIPVLVLFAAAACGPNDAPATPAMAVVRTFPELEPTGTPLFLNQRIRVEFSRPVDRLSVTKDTIRVTDASGLAVSGRLSIGTQSVAFEPDPPLSASFADGSLKPDSVYRIEIAGFPSANAVRAADGRLLERTFQRSFRTLSQRQAAERQVSMLLPVDRGDTPFQVRADRPLRVAVDQGTLLIPFTLPPYPSSVTPAAFRLLSPHTGGVVPLARARVVTRPAPEDPFLGCTVELTVLDRRALRHDPMLMLVLATDESGVRDYHGRTVEPIVPDAAYIPVELDPGAARRLFHENFRDPREVVFPVSQRIAGPGFVTEAGVARLRVPGGAGTGALGDFRPQRSMTLRPGVPFDRGDGVVVVADGSDFDFRTVYVPQGVIVRCASNPGQRLRIRVAGDVRIDGEWLVDAAVDGASSATLVPSATFDAALRAAPTSIVCGGRWSTGAGSRIGTTTTGTGPGRDLAVLVSGAVDCATPLGARILLAVGVETDVRGATPTLRLSEWPAASSHLAAVVGESWTRWYPLGHAGLAGVECELDGAVGDVQVFAQVASPDPFDPLRPDLTPAVLSVPVAIPNAAPLYVPPDGFVRFLLRGAARADAPPPSVSGISILARP